METDRVLKRGTIMTNCFRRDLPNGAVIFGKDEAHVNQAIAELKGEAKPKPEIKTDLVTQAIMDRAPNGVRRKVPYLG